MITGCAGTGPPPGDGKSALKVCIVTSSPGLKDRSFNRLAVEGSESAGVKPRVIESQADSEYLSNLQKCLRDRPDLTIGVSPLMATAVWRAAQGNPRSRFALVDASPIDNNGEPAELPNVTDLMLKVEESGYLVGVLAGLMENKRVGAATHNITGVLGTNHTPAVDSYIAGYLAGARSVDAAIGVKLSYSDSQDPAFCKQLGLEQIKASADILLAVTGRCAVGYIDAAYDASAYAIGTDEDQANLSPAVITSALKRVDRAVFLTIVRLRQGSFRSGRQVFSLKDDATGFTTPSSVVPQDIINQVIEVKAKIKSGAITPPDKVE
jgi:basic membrane protein A